MNNTAAYIRIRYVINFHAPLRAIFIHSLRCYQSTFEVVVKGPERENKQ